MSCPVGGPTALSRVKRLRRTLTHAFEAQTRYLGRVLLGALNQYIILRLPMVGPDLFSLRCAAHLF